MSSTNGSSELELQPASLRSSLTTDHSSEEFRRFQTNNNNNGGRNSSSGMMSKQVNERLSELTINKLQFDAVGLVGRSKEVSTIQNCLSRMMITSSSSSSQTKEDHADSANDENDTTEAPPQNSLLVRSHVQKEICFIGGFSGVGKTKLAQTLQKQVSENYKDGVFVEGKFDMNAAISGGGGGDMRPYSALSRAFGAILRELRKKEDSGAFGQLIQETIGTSALGALVNLIPELGEFFSDHQDQKTSSWNESDFDNSLDRWKFAFRSLARAITSILSPLVIVLDDLQRADIPSLEMFTHLITDIQNPNPLMVIGCYRSNEVDSYSVLTLKINDLKSLTDKYGFNVTEITLESCLLEDVNEMIMAMTSIDDPSITKDLAELCFKRTMGNPFFLIEFMKMLLREELLSFSLGLMKWTYDVAKIEESTMSTANVATLLQTRIRFLSKDLQQLLKLAACLGPTFRLGTLLVLWKSRDLDQTEDQVLDEVLPLLSKAQEEMLVEICAAGDNLYQWVHDRVQEAIMMLDTSDLNALQFSVGQQLLQGLVETQLEEDLFIVTDLINRGSIQKKTIEFAELNLRAARKARSVSAFQVSASYALKGINMLSEDSWSTDHSLALDLYTIGAQMQLISGNIDIADEYSQEIFKQESVTIMETLPLRIARAWTLSSVESKHAEATEYVINLLRELGYNQIWRASLASAQALAAFPKTLKLVKDAPKDFYKALEIVTDPKTKAISDLLHLLHYSSYMSGRLFLVALSCCKDVELTMKHGITENSARSFCNLGGFVLHLREDYETTLRLAESAFAIQKIIGETNRGITIQEAHANGFCFAKPLQNSIPLLTEAYILSMRAGDTEYACWSLLFFVAMVPYILGKKLAPLLEECKKALTQVEEAGRADHVVKMKLMIHLIATLHGQKSQQSDKSYFIPEEWKTTPMYIGASHFAKSELLFFSNLEGAAELALQNGDLLKKSLPGTILNMISTFHQATSLYTMARRTKKRKYGATAKRLRKTLQRWVTAGNPNLIHYVMLLDAEDAALTKNIEVATENYQKAIVFAGRIGELHHAGMFNERYADFLLDACNDAEGAKHQINQAIRYYQDWGADGKVADLQKKCESL